MYLVRTSAQMKRADANTINAGLPSLVLMERAALSVLKVIENEDLDLSDVLILCGPGNNGGDGAAVARLLAEEGYSPSIKVFGDPLKYSAELKTQLSLLEHYEIRHLNKIERLDSSLIIDCVFGVGLKREVTGEIAELFNSINDSDIPVVSVDIPSGLDADSGRILGTALFADITVGISDPKPGYYICDGISCCGDVYIENIGIMEASDDDHSGYIITEEDMYALPPRNEAGNKGTFGKLLVIAGSENISGAAFLCAKAALKCGIGMVHIFTHRNNRAILGTLLPEALITVYDDDSKDLDKLKGLLEWADAVVIGPGIGTGDFSCALLDRFLKYNTLPAVLDADALNIIASDEKYESFEAAFPCVITPHMGEMSRLVKADIQDIKASPLEYACSLAKESGMICVLKDAVTITAYPDGMYYINTSGCSALATAGSGDVLSGIIAGYILRYKNNELPLVPMAVYEHGKRGEDAAEKIGADAVTASDLL